MTDDLPKSNATPPQTPTGSMTKETGPVIGLAEAPVVAEIAKEAQLSPEVEKAGVKVQSDTVVLPQPVQQLGVKPVGGAAPAQGATTTALPLSDDQIAKGLQASIMTSWRWLAEWCRRQVRILWN